MESLSVKVNPMKRLALVLILTVLVSGCASPKLGGWVKEGVELYSETWQKDIEFCQGNQYQQIMPADIARISTDYKKGKAYEK